MLQMVSAAMGVFRRWNRWMIRTVEWVLSNCQASFTVSSIVYAGKALEVRKPEYHHWTTISNLLLQCCIYVASPVKFQVNESLNRYNIWPFSPSRCYWSNLLLIVDMDIDGKGHSNDNATEFQVYICPWPRNRTHPCRPRCTFTLIPFSSVWLQPSNPFLCCFLFTEMHWCLFWQLDLNTPLHVCEKLAYHMSPFTLRLCLLVLDSNGGKV